jgi:hypothetical protein
MDEKILQDLICEARPEVSAHEAREWSFRVIQRESFDSVDLEDEPIRERPKRSDKGQTKRPLVESQKERPKTRSKRKSRRPD